MVFSIKSGIVVATERRGIKRNDLGRFDLLLMTLVK